MVIEGVGGRSIEREATLKDEEVFPWLLPTFRGNA